MFIERLAAAEQRLAKQAARNSAMGLTSADTFTGERWEWGQVWAHLAEFVPYWMREVRGVARAGGHQPAPFGRTKADPDRLAVIERDRSRPTAELWGDLQHAMAELRDLLGEMDDKAWKASGRHQTLGVMPMERIVDEFLVGHLEEHAAQLEGLGVTAPEVS